MHFDLTAIDHFLYQCINGLAGRWRWFDSLVAVSAADDLIKASVIGACFFAAWHSQRSPEETHRARRALLITLVACVFVLATTKLISHLVILPRPYILSQKVYVSRGSTLVPCSHLDSRAPLDSRSQQRLAALRQGSIPSGDWGSFPSDHAAFFFTLSLGILLASRRAGLVALAWTLLVILGGKVILGLHTPLDIAAAAAIAAAWLGIIWTLAKLPLGRPLDGLTAWTAKHAALSSALLFVVVFEISSTLEHVQELAGSIGRHVLGVG